MVVWRNNIEVPDLDKTIDALSGCDSETIANYISNVDDDLAVAILSDERISASKVVDVLLNRNKIPLNRAVNLLYRIDRDFRSSGYTINDNWDDTSLVYDTGATGTTVELDYPATSYKSVYESGTTSSGHDPRFRAIPDGVLKNGRVLVKGYVGAYHGYNATRANWRITIFSGSYYVEVGFAMSTFGWSNGSYNNLLVLGIEINSDGTVSVVSMPSASLGVSYSSPKNLIGSTVTVGIGHHDGWDADWNQWSTMRNDGVIMR